MTSRFAHHTPAPRAMASSKQARVLVIGCGNPLRGDDGLGWHVTQALSNLNLEHLEVITRHQLTPELAEEIAAKDRVIFVDATLETQPGKMITRELEPKSATGTLTHHVTPESLLALAQTLYGRVPFATAIAVGVSSLEHSEQLSPEVSAAMPKVVEAILQCANASSA